MANTQHETIQSIIQKSSFNNHIKNIPTNIKKLMLSSDSGDLIYNILPKANNNPRGFKISELNQGLKTKQPKNKTENNTNKNMQLLYPSSSKSLTTRQDWLKKQPKTHNSHFLEIDTLEAKRVSVSERQSRSRQSNSGMNTPQKGDSQENFKINFASEKNQDKIDEANQRQKQLQKIKHQARKTHRSIQQLQKEKAKRISRFLFQIQIPEELKQKANYKLKKFKVVDDPNLLSQNNSKVLNTAGSFAKQPQKRKPKQLEPTQKGEKPKKGGVPDFIKPSLKIIENFSQAFDFPHRQEPIKNSLIKKELIFQDIQFDGIHTKNIQCQKRKSNVKFFLKTKKSPWNNSSGNIPQKVIRQINTCPSQNTIVPKVDTHQLFFKTKQQRLNQRMLSQEKFRETAIKFKRDNLKTHQKKNPNERNQEINNICGWEMNDNNAQFY